MKVEEIQALAGLQLAAHVAAYMGYTVVQGPSMIVGAKPPACYMDERDARGLLCWEPGAGLHTFRPDRSLDDAARMRAFVRGVKREGDFIAALWLLSDEQPDHWALVDASAVVQCRAFVLVMDRTDGR